MELTFDMRQEQNQHLLDMNEQLASMQSGSTQLRQAKEAPDQGDGLQSHPERPSLPETTAIVPDASPGGPELAKDLSATPNDDVALEETVDVEPMQEDIASDHPAPRPKAERLATTTQMQATEPVSGNISQASGDEDRTQEVSRLPGPSVETPSTNTETKASTQSADLPPWPVLPPNPPMPKRNIARLANTGAGRFPAGSDAHDVFVTPGSEVLKILKGYK